MQPGLSVAKVALEHDINAVLLLLLPKPLDLQTVVKHLPFNGEALVASGSKRCNRSVVGGT
ncbi:MAG: hypothetical protein CTY19_08935 [Methylomonas sp.]|nr:MAG: hypothetical protein CTY19_08935 [Methylomonas sp.]